METFEIYMVNSRRV